VYRNVDFYEHVFPYQRIDDTSNEIDNPNIHGQSPFMEDQPILSQSLQVIFAPCDNADNGHESDILVPEELCSHKDQNLNENHKTTQIIRMSTRIKRSPEYLKDHHSNLNVFNTSSRVKYPLNYILSYNKLSHSYTSFVMSFSSHVEPNTYSKVVKHDCWRKTIYSV